jgi:hypothetical protein
MAKTLDILLDNLEGFTIHNPNPREAFENISVQPERTSRAKPRFVRMMKEVSKSIPIIQVARVFRHQVGFAYQPRSLHELTVDQVVQLLALWVATNSLPLEDLLRKQRGVGVETVAAMRKVLRKHGYTFEDIERL